MTNDVAQPDLPGPTATRRTVLGGVGATAVGVLTGCRAYDADPSAAAPAAAEQAGPQLIAKVSEVPVRGGIVTRHGVVVTQPTAGDYRGFSSVCTHQGCTVGRVQFGVIICDCHGSLFRIEDGAVDGGPARRNLPEIKVVRDGDEIVRTR